MVRQNEVVSLEYRVNKSFEGKYFIGHTPIIPLHRNLNSLGGLVNPKNSRVNLYINTFNISNSTPVPFKAQIYLNSTPIGDIMTSTFISPANTAINPLPRSKANIVYSQDISGEPSNGVSIFSRIAEPDSTIIGNYYGKIVIPPGGSFIVFLLYPGAQCLKVDVGFGWWEEKV